MIKHLIFLILWGLTLSLGAAVGCDLNDPNRDIKRLFPESTGYSTVYKNIQTQGGKALLLEIEKRLGDKFVGLYETIDVPYTVYEIKKGKERIGWIHGVNQKGKHGGIQVFLVLDRKHTIKDIYYQRMASRSSEKLKDKSFVSRFKGLSHKELSLWDISKGKGSGKLENIKTPSAEAEKDFQAVMRAIKKNLILMDVFFPQNGG